MPSQPLSDAFEAIRTIRIALNSIEGTLLSPKKRIGKIHPKVLWVMQYIGNVYVVSVDEMVARGRCREIFAARSVVVWILREVMNLSLRQIGKILNRVDHNTIQNSITYVKDRMDTEPEFKQELLGHIAHCRKEVKRVP